FRTSAKSVADSGMLFRLNLSYFARTATTRSGSEIPGGFNSSWFTRLKMAVFAPTPRARAATEVRVKPGLWLRVRHAKRRFESMASYSDVITHSWRWKFPERTRRYDTIRLDFEAQRSLTHREKYRSGLLGGFRADVRRPCPKQGRYPMGSQISTHQVRRAA